MSDSQQKYRLSFKPKEMVIGAQMLFVAFGALVLVPLLTGLNANVALFTAGAGTLLFQVITRGKVPVFLASSFAFIAPIIYGVQQWGIPGTMCGLLAAGGLYIIISFSIRIFGSDILHRILPPIVTGPVIMVIGLVLAPVAVHMASGRTGDGSAWLVPQPTAFMIAGVALATTILVSLLGKGIFRLIPILCGIIAGYLTALILDASGTSASIQAAFDPGSLQNWTGPTLVSMQNVLEAPWLAMPDFTLPAWNLEAILFIVPVAIAPAIEHFGDVLAIGSITGKDYVDDPGIDKTMLGDGLATCLAALLGGPPNTTYSEVSGAVALTRSFNPVIMTCLHWQTGGNPEHHPGTGYGRHHGAALRCDCRYRHQYPGKSRHRPDASTKSDNCCRHPGLRHRRHEFRPRGCQARRHRIGRGYRGASKPDFATGQ